MIRELVRVRDRNQVTLPGKIVSKLDLRPGSLLEVNLTEEGVLELRAIEILVKGTPAADREARAAKGETAQGGGESFGTASSFERHIAGIRERVEASRHEAGHAVQLPPNALPRVAAGKKQMRRVAAAHARHEKAAE